MERSRALMEPAHSVQQLPGILAAGSGKGVSCKRHPHGVVVRVLRLGFFRRQAFPPSV